MPLGDWATWVTGIITLGLFVVGFIQIRNEREARKQTEKDRLFKERREQAEHIAAWLVGEIGDGNGSFHTWVAVRNQSPQPIYHLIIQGIVLSNDGSVHNYANVDHQARIDVVPPGEGYVIIPFEDWGGMFRRPGIEFAFQDAANYYWLRSVNGELIEINDPPLFHYQITLPTDWNRLEPDLPQNIPPVIS